MATLVWILLSTIAVSLIAFIGILALMLKEKVLDKLLLVLVALSAGALMGGAFLHLIPEAAENNSTLTVGLSVLLGFSLFFFIEKILHWRHCHDEKCTIHTFAYMNLIGDSIHNFLDGLIIAASFVTSTPLGINTTLAVMLHEIPQEIGDFGVLVYGKMKKSRALFLNFVTALMAVAGGILGYFISSATSYFTNILVPIAAGGFIYIAATDLIPELKKEIEIKKVLGTFSIFVAGIALMYFMKVFLGA
ncbi:MAG: ZIP family metal transporter [Candidatus Woesearchaeota archaeon]